jgi:hypothetical protein
MQDKDTTQEKLFSFFDTRDSFSGNDDASTTTEPEFVFGDIPSEPDSDKENSGSSSSKEFRSDLLEQIIQICISYSLISSLFNYTVRCDGLLSHLSLEFKNQNKENINQQEQNSNDYAQTANNIFDLCVHNLYCKALQKFQKFAEKCKLIFIRESNKSMLEDFQRLTFFINNFKNLFMSIFPKKGTMVQTNTNQRENNEHVLPELNLIGADVAYYLNESAFSYEPTYEFRKDNLDFDSLHQTYMKYMNKYQNGNLEITKETLDEIRSLKYFLQVSCVMNMYKFLLCVQNLNFEEYMDGKGVDVLQNAFDRIEFHNLANEKAEENEQDDVDEDDFGILVM